MNGFERRTEEKKKKVLESTFELMNSSDDGNITMEEIAKHANVGKTTIFKYFDSKDNLIHEVYKSFLDQLIEEAEEVLDENKSFEETLIALTQNKIRFLNRINKRFYTRMMKYITEKNENGLSLIIQRYTRDSYSTMLDLFHRGRKEGKVDLKYSDEFLLLYFRTIVEGLSNPQIYEQATPYIEEWTEMLLKGIAPRKRD
ncbi:TetR/AcrR family transcriptional regulator [Irregularibacter muris]|uniref:TetR/AcrR family transcriptional regulator n=1 Tax=Irregularibacter muris TaxID=1796619 RepID=A0AAE3HDJ0_9FIRM|nr:TetR/AcrR family transcriptional regulator [Irregularibacter muris]MCR1898422.1 TetR/AcrR family transcriptional regulator [Irregularibacter muris]